MRRENAGWVTLRRWRGPRQVLGLQQGKSVFNEFQVHTCPYHMYEQHVKSAFLILEPSCVTHIAGLQGTGANMHAEATEHENCLRALLAQFGMFPRIRFGHLPTPPEPLDRLSEGLPGRVYRLGNGGDKTRKPGFLVVEAKEQRADCLIFQGITPRKDGHQTAAAAANLEKA